MLLMLHECVSGASGRRAPVLPFIWPLNLYTRQNQGSSDWEKPFNDLREQGVPWLAWLSRLSWLSCLTLCLLHELRRKR